MPGQPAVSVRYYRPSDEEAVLRVIQASFAPWPAFDIGVAPIDHLRWKIECAPDPEATHMVAEANGQIVGIRLCLVRDYSNNGARVTVRTDTDNAVLPEWRGRGVNAAIGDSVFESSPAELILSSTREPSLIRRDQDLGHRPLRNRFVSASSLLSQSFPGAAAMSVSEIARFDERIMKLWTLAVQPYEFILAPSVNWLNWRFCDQRGGNGFVLQTEENTDVTGFIVARTSRGKGHIAYLLALPGRGDVIQPLIAACMTRLRDAGVAEAICTLPEHHPYRETLLALGFTHKRRRIPVTTRLRRTGDPERPFRHDPYARIHLMLGDFDFI